MSKKAIIFASEHSFGELINQVFDDFGAYESQSVELDSLRTDLAKFQDLDLAVLDADLGFENVNAVAKILHRESPNLRVVLLPARNQPSDANANIQADFVLNSPFYLPDLISVLHKLAASWPKDAEMKSAFEDSPSAAWKTDQGLAAQYLTQLALEAASEAAIIIKERDAWAFVGELPQPAIEELLASLAHYWQEDAATDFARFVHLNSTDEDYMLYAKLLEPGFALAMVFNANLPFSKMRSKVSEMAHALLSRSAAEPTMLSEEEVFIQDEQTINHGKNLQASTQESRRSIPVRELEAPKVHSGISFESQVKREPLKEGEILDQSASTTRDLLYTFVLIPRLPEHQLTGDLAYQITKWIPQLCLAYAARLEYLKVGSQSLHWTLSINPDTAPKKLVKSLGHQLSLRIFNTFPSLAQENPSQEFWAKKALIMNGARVSAQSITQYIQLTRVRQGIHREP